MSNEELNKKLAEWAGCVLYEDYTYFTDSLDACFKWLVPKLQGLFYSVNLSIDWLGGIKEWQVLIRWKRNAGGYEDIVEFSELNSNLALALCLAIEKLIDKEEK